MRITTVNIVGPDGTLVEADKAFPDAWDTTFADAVVQTGGGAEVADDYFRQREAARAVNESLQQDIPDVAEEKREKGRNERR